MKVWLLLKKKKRTRSLAVKRERTRCADAKIIGWRHTFVRGTPWSAAFLGDSTALQPMLKRQLAAAQDRNESRLLDARDADGLARSPRRGRL